MKKAPIILLFLLLISTAMHSQSRRDNATTNIMLLKNGALFVRLKTSENMINTLLRQGDKQGAEDLRKQQDRDNREIVKAFHDNFDFCPVYFFFSNNSTKIKNGKYKNLLLNNLYQRDTVFTGSSYLIGAFGNSETTKIEGFIFEDKNFEQLDAPFPFLIRLNKNGIISRSKPEMAVAINKALHSFYEDVKTN